MRILRFPIKAPRRPSPATGLAAVALFLAAGGPAAAVDTASAGARLITGKQVKDNSIDSRDVRDGSLTAKDFKKGVLSAGALPGSPGTPRDGAPGERGPQGIQGERGPQGVLGPQGLPGAPGEPGAKGEPGAAGAPGAKGDTGAKGDAGANGDTGAKGDTGAQGTQGPKGDKGDPGTPAAPEPFRIVGTSGQPGFAKDVGFPGYEWWHANDSNVNQVAFYKDAFGTVHLKGKAKCVGTTCNSASLMFQLPAGYRPAQLHIFAQLTDKTGQGAGVATRVNVEPSGWVSRAPTPLDSQNGWIALDGITFRAVQ